MKISDGFDARRLRPKGQSNWRLRLGAGFAALLAMLGLLLAIAGAAGLFGHSPALGELNASPGGSAILVVVGLLILWLGVWLWRRCRRRMRQPLSLNIASHLMKKHD
jgi:protein-S-isoprenylcysteine O-methyltransferase Ste14